MQRYKFVEGVDEAWMEYDDHLPRDDQRAHVAEQSPLYLCSEVDAHLADMRAGFQLELASKDARIAQLKKAAKAVCDYDWSDNDEDAVRAVEKLRSIL